MMVWSSCSLVFTTSFQSSFQIFTLSCVIIFVMVRQNAWNLKSSLVGNVSFHLHSYIFKKNSRLAQLRNKSLNLEQRFFLKHLSNLELREYCLFATILQKSLDLANQVPFIIQSWVKIYYGCNQRRYPMRPHPPLPPPSIIVMTLAIATSKTSLLFHLAHINKGHHAPTMHMPYMPNVSARYQCLHLNPRLRYRSSSLISFVPTN
jgi:hypothetical protein